MLIYLELLKHNYIEILINFDTLRILIIFQT